MPNIEQTNEALVQLQEELKKFKSTKNLLDDKQKELNALCEKWKKSEKNNQDNVEKLTEIVQASTDLISQQGELFEKLGSRLQTLAKSVEDVNFPSRLDRLDNSISSSTIATQEAQQAVNKLQDNLERIESTQENIKDKAEKTRKAMRTNLALLIAGGLIAFALYLTHLFDWFGVIFD